jgi:hypothetical protein
MASHQQNVCYGCKENGQYTPIKFNAKMLSPRGKPLPLELGGSVHNCPFKPSLSQYWGFDPQEYRSSQRKQPQPLPPEQSTPFYPTDIDNNRIAERLVSVERRLNSVIEYIRKQQERDAYSGHYNGEVGQ